MATEKDINYLQVEGTAINKEFPETTVGTVDIIDPHALLEYWQIRLRLMDWEIELYPDCVESDFIVSGRSGEVSWNEMNKSADIRILKEECFNKTMRPKYNFELTLVHELLHLKFLLVQGEQDTLHYRLMHQIIEDLAKAFTEKGE